LTTGNDIVLSFLSAEKSMMQQQQQQQQQQQEQQHKIHVLNVYLFNVFFMSGNSPFFL